MITDWHIHMLLERTAGSVLSLFPCISIELFIMEKFRRNRLLVLIVMNQISFFLNMLKLG